MLGRRTGRMPLLLIGLGFSLLRYHLLLSTYRGTSDKINYPRFVLRGSDVWSNVAIVDPSFTKYRPKVASRHLGVQTGRYNF